MVIVAKQLVDEEEAREQKHQSDLFALYVGLKKAS